VTGNHPTSTGPISIAASRTPVLVFSTSVLGIMQLGFQAISKNLMHRITQIDIDCSVFKIVGYVRGLPLLVGLKLGMLVLLSSELWFGASDNPLVTFTWSSKTSSADFWEIL
jgi:hypothetical protein